MAAAIQIAIVYTATENGQQSNEYAPVGSGTVVSPDGLILTNQHVISLEFLREHLDAWAAEARADGNDVTFNLDESQFLVLTADRDGQPTPSYRARVLKADSRLDIAVLQIVADEFGAPVSGSSLNLPSVPLGRSDALRLGDSIDVFAYPNVGGDSLTYSTGVVSGFLKEEGIDGRAWIKTDAVLSGGSSGGTAVDRAGNLIGIPTQGSSLDCRPGDTNNDGTIDTEDVGCVPTGGSIGQLRPVSLALPLLKEAGLDPSVAETVASRPPVSTPGMSVPGDMSPKCAETHLDQFKPGDRVKGVPWSLPRSWYERQLFPSEVISSTQTVPNQLDLEVESEDPHSSTHSSGNVVGVIKIIGPRVDCRWPIELLESGTRAKSKLSNSYGRLIRCRSVASTAPTSVPECIPDFPTRSLDSTARQYCPVAPLYTTGTTVFVVDPTRLQIPAFDWKIEPSIDLSIGTALIIGAPVVEAGICDYWPVYLLDPQTGEVILHRGSWGYIPEDAVRPSQP